QQQANLMIIAGNRDDIRDMESGAQQVLTNILLLIDAFDLYGKVAFPKAHQSEEVPAIYRIVAASKGIFINPALTEPFGLTLLEAAASGIPLIATENGGPVDIISNCENGILVDPLDREAITHALSQLLTDKKTWTTASNNGIKNVRKYYSWQAHAKTYVDKISRLEGKYQPIPTSRPERAGRYRDRAIFTDLDQNLIGNPTALKYLVDLLKENRKCVSFGIATGRRIDSALALMNKHGIPRPDVLISSQGTRVHYGQQLTEDNYWADHIDHNWTIQRLRKTIGNLPGIKSQHKNEQTPFKASYFYDENKAPSVEEIIILLGEKELNANVILSFGQFLDLVPGRASKGQALRYVTQRLDIPLEQTLVAGGSGADEDMMRGNTLAVVVGNRHYEELSLLTEQDSIYFASQSYGSGILEAIDHYDFFGSCSIPEQL
ncbi:MAG: sucrose-phosphate synthase, partial [Parasphingorhabdus sp.]